MNRTFLHVAPLWMATSACLVHVSPVAANERECPGGPAVAEIEAQREAFNAAIEFGELDVIERVLAADVVLIAGTHSDRFLDRAAQLEIWREEFDRNRDRLVYVRTPACIRLSSIGPMASERGTWRGENASGDFASGSYTAKWRRIEGDWQLEAEVFMTEDCGGDGCPVAGD